MFVVVAYDIPSTPRRTKLAHLLGAYGERVQKSVFECDIEPDQWQRLEKSISGMLKPVDKARYYFLCQSCLRRVVVVGAGKVARAPRVIIV